MEWTIQDLGALGEFIGSMAVLTTLIYLSIQVRQARLEQQRAVLEARTEAVRDSYLRVATSPSLASAAVKLNDAVQEPHPFIVAAMDVGLDRTEAMQVFARFMASFRLNITQFQTIQDEYQRSANDANLRRIYGTGPGRMFWDYMRVSGRSRDPEFIDHVDNLIGATPAD
jgi:hypothetical protein